MSYWRSQLRKYKYFKDIEERKIKKAENAWKRAQKEKELSLKKVTVREKIPKKSIVKKSLKVGSITPSLNNSHVAGKKKHRKLYFSSNTEARGTQLDLLRKSERYLKECKEKRVSQTRKDLVEKLENMINKIIELKDSFKNTTWCHPYDKSDTAVSVNSLISYSYKYLLQLNMINKLGVKIEIPDKLMI